MTSARAAIDAENANNTATRLCGFIVLSRVCNDRRRTSRRMNTSIVRALQQRRRAAVRMQTGPRHSIGAGLLLIRSAELPSQPDAKLTSHPLRCGLPNYERLYGEPRNWLYTGARPPEADVPAVAAP